MWCGVGKNKGSRVYAMIDPCGGGSFGFGACSFVVILVGVIELGTHATVVGFFGRHGDRWGV